VREEDHRVRNGYTLIPEYVVNPLAHHRKRFCLATAKTGAVVLAVVLALLSLAFVVGNACHSISQAPMSTKFPVSQPNTVTYIGHATVLLRLNGTTVITDPLYSEYVGLYRRYVQPGVAIEDLPPLDAVVISHGHWDHLDKSTLRRFDKRVVVVVPDGLQGSIRELGFREVRGLNEWQTTTVGGAEITAVPAKHFGTSCGYLVRNKKTVYLAGDTGLFDAMRTIGERQSIDLALLPIGGYRPHLWFVPGASSAMRRVHMAPEDVPEAATMLNAKLVVPIHWGTFKLTGEPSDEPLTRLQRTIRDKALDQRVRVIVPGETAAF
jgi:L-ascorbate metabolism protein UlaG (beta-lactamase superfamily)